MRRPGGYATITDPDKPLVELDTTTCAHCQKVTHIKARARPEDLGGLCKACMGLICQHCVGKGCDPFEKQLERSEARQEALRSYGLA